MKRNIAIVVLAVMLVASWTYFLMQGRPAVVSLSPRAAGSSFSPMSSSNSEALAELATLEQVPSSSPDYARAQRLMGYNVYGAQFGNWAEAKKHVDIALQTSPNDPKVLEDAGRVYVKLGLVSEGVAMLKRADTPVADRALAELHGD